MQIDTGIPSYKDVIFIFYDLETRQEKINPDGSILHKPNLYVFKQCCDVCDGSEKVVCDKCGLRLQVIK